MADEQMATPFTTTPQVVQSFPYSDIISGTSFFTVYGAILGTTSEGSDTTTETLVLDQNTTFSINIEDEKTGSNEPGDSYETLTGITWTFTLSAMNDTRILFGTGSIEHCYLGKYYGGTSGQNMLLKLKYILKKNGVEIVSIFSPMNQPGSTYNLSTLVSTPMTIPNTVLRKSDVLTLTVEGWGRQSDPSSDRKGRIIIGTDPKNRDGTQLTPTTNNEETTQLKLKLPFIPIE